MNSATKLTNHRVAINFARAALVGVTAARSHCSGVWVQGLGMVYEQSFIGNRATSTVIV